MGVLRGAPGFLFGAASGLQTFTLGATFTACRTAVLAAWTTDQSDLTPRDLTKASAVAGGVSGALVGTITRGRSNAIPGAFMMTIFGAAGQHLYSRWATSSLPDATATQKGFWKRITEQRWSPVKLLTNEEYLDMLHEKLLKVDVEIAVIDDKINALKQQQKSAENSAASTP